MWGVWKGFDRKKQGVHRGGKLPINNTAVFAAFPLHEPSLGGCGDALQATLRAAQPFVVEMTVWAVCSYCSACLHTEAPSGWPRGVGGCQRGGWVCVCVCVQTSCTQQSRCKRAGSGSGVLCCHTSSAVKLLRHLLQDAGARGVLTQGLEGPLLAAG